MTKAAITLAAQAKINITLRVGPRKADGYHDIETLFQRIDLADEVSVRVDAKPSTLDVTWKAPRPSELGPVEHNLAWRAAAAYRATTGWPAQWHIGIIKRIPAGAGLGGGSADAAAVLRALDQLAPTPIGAPRLLELASALGADVSFFARGASLAAGSGRGERLRVLPALPVAHVLLAIPRFPIDTAGAYAALDAWRANNNIDTSIRRDTDADLGVGSWPGVAGLQANDFEGAMFAQHPELAEARQELAAKGALIARLSGSGSTVFGLWPGESPPPSAFDLPRGWKTALTQTI